MLTYLSSILSAILAIGCIVVLLRLYLNKDKTLIWSPMTFLVLTILYYWVMPEYFNSREFEGYHVEQFSIPFHVGSVLSFISILIGYYKLNPNSKTSWTKCNNYFTEKNAKNIAIIMFVVSLLCYIPFRGLHFSIFTSSSKLQDFDYENVGFDYYFVNSIAILCTACILAFINWKKHKALFFFIMWMTLVTYITAGFRYRIIILVISLFTFYYLYKGIKKIKILPIVLIAFVCYFGFNVMDRARSYGNGINIDVLKSTDREELTAQAGETERVYNFSIMVMNGYYESGQREYFDPLLTAFFMPIPRVIFPWKPNAAYAYNATKVGLKAGGVGSVYVCFVEAFMAFGWLGIIINGLFIGWLSRRFWNNYKNNPNSLGALIALALFNGLTYVIISRGYLAQEYSCFLYYICVPFLLASLYCKMKRI